MISSHVPFSDFRDFSWPDICKIVDADRISGGFVTVSAMFRTDEALHDVIIAFQDAALDDDLWMPALAKMAGLTGSMCGQLIGFGPTGHVAFNWITEAPPEMFESLAAVGGDDPRVNSRIRLGTRAPLLTVVDESVFETDEDCRRYPAYGDHMARWDTPYVACANLIRDGSLSVGLSVNRNARQGGLTAEQEALFAALLPHVQGAIRLRSAWAGKAAASMIASVQALGVTAYLCDAQASVLAMTGSGETLATEAGPVSIVNGRLQVRSRAPEELRCTLARLSRPTAEASSATLVLHDPRTAREVACDVFRLSERSAEPLGRDKLLVVVRCDDEATQRRVAATAACVFSLTPAETDIVSALTSGRSPESIAADRRTSVGTIRSQIRSLYEKTGATNQLALLSLINRHR